MGEKEVWRSGDKEKKSLKTLARRGENGLIWGVGVGGVRWVLNFEFCNFFNAFFTYIYIYIYTYI